MTIRNIIDDMILLLYYNKKTLSNDQKVSAAWFRF